MSKALSSLSPLDPTDPPYLIASQESNVNAILEYFPHAPPSKEELTEILVVALRSSKESVEVVKYCLDNGAMLAEDRGDVWISCPFEAIQMVYKVFPTVIETKLDAVVNSICWRPSIAGFEFLLKKRWLVEEIFEKVLLMPATFGIYYGVVKYHQKSTSANRLQCLQYMDFHGLVPQSKLNLTGALVWAERDHFEWLLKRFPNDHTFDDIMTPKTLNCSKFTYTPLELYLGSHCTADLAIVDMILHAGCPITAAALVESLVLTNGLEYLDFIFEKVGSDKIIDTIKKSELSGMTFGTFFVGVIARLLESEGVKKRHPPDQQELKDNWIIVRGLFDVLPEKRKRRLNQWSEVIQSFAIKKVPEFEPKGTVVEGLLLSVKNAYFRQRLSTIIAASS